MRLRPRDAASLILFDRSGGRLRVLMGRRSGGHVFMPGVYVFPGGRRDPRDHALPYAKDLAEPVIADLCRASQRRLTAAGARALALAAIRELREETGLVFSGAVGRDNQPDLSVLRFVARAITPPQRVRRYDTRFFACFSDEAGIDPCDATDSEELEDVGWLDIADNSGLNMAPITRMVLEDVTKFMIGDRRLQFDAPVRQYFERRGIFYRGFL